MKTINVQQGSPEWSAIRAKHFTASEAPAMMGVSKYQSREDLLKLKATGISPEIDDRTQALFDKGHAAEAAIRPHIESFIGDELFPATGSLEVEGLPLLASFDGVTLMQDIDFEHKLWNEALAASVREDNLDMHYCFQLEQQLLVSGAEKALFVTSDGSPSKMEQCWYVSRPKVRKALIAGWKQFAEDLSTYEVTPEEAKPETKAIMELPALTVEIHGNVKNSNMATYEQNVAAFIQSINTDLQTDEDFAQAELTVKFCSKAEKQLDLVKEQALAQTADIDKLFKTVDRLKEDMRTKRLALDKLVKSQKDMIRGEIVTEAKAKFADHLASLNDGLGGDYVLAISADFAGVMKGKKTVKSLRSAVNDEMARVKIESNDVAEKIRANLKVLSETADEYRFLFNDLRTIVTKDGDDFALLVRSRVDDHKQAEEKRLETERERIREEEEAKAKAKTTATPEPVAEKPAASGAVDSPKINSDTNKHAKAARDLTDYEQGWIDGVTLYAHWKDGVQEVGTTGRTLKSAISNFLKKQAA